VKSLANGSRPQPPQVMRTTIVHQFGWGVTDTEGIRNLQIHTPQGELIVLPFTPDKAQECGMALMAPSVVRP
jgi:hypothetical protein